MHLCTFPLWGHLTPPVKLSIETPPRGKKKHKHIKRLFIPIINHAETTLKHETLQTLPRCSVVKLRVTDRTPWNRHLLVGVARYTAFPLWDFRCRCRPLKLSELYRPLLVSCSSSRAQDARTAARSNPALPSSLPGSMGTPPRIAANLPVSDEAIPFSRSQLVRAALNGDMRCACPCRIWTRGGQGQ